MATGTIGDAPPFPLPLYAGDAGEADRCSTELRRQHTALGAVGEGVDSRARVATGSVDGVLTAPILEAGRAPGRKAARLAGASLLAAGVTTAFADAIRTYDAEVERLNEVYLEARARRFGVSGLAGVTAGEHLSEAERADELAARVDAADRELRRQLGAEERRARQLLDDTGDDLARLLDEGPTDEALIGLVSDGHLPPTAALTSVMADGADDAVPALLLQHVADGVLPPSALSMTPAELREHLIAHPEAAAALMANRLHPGLPGEAGRLASLVGPAIVAPGGGAAHHERVRADVRALFEGMSADDASVLAMLFPADIGNQSGVPFANRADANTVAVIDALARERENLSGLTARGQRHYSGFSTVGSEDEIAASQDRIELYESILADDRQILLFDASGDGRIAELHGTIGPGTDDLGVHVPGTGTDMSTFEGITRRSRSFVANDPNGELSMISWLGGDMPDGVARDAPFNHYARDMAPALADFSRDVRQELDRSPAADNRPSTTYLGHSYGGATVGLAETHGLDADRVLHVASAGMGHGVDDPSDLPESQSGVNRYSMTAPDDFIGMTQGRGWGDDIGHGADPDDFPGTDRLHTGDFSDDGGRIDGPVAAHSDVFTPQSDAWLNMLAVLTGGEAEGYRPPTYVRDGQGPGAPLRPAWGEGEMVDVP